MNSLDLYKELINNCDTKSKIEKVILDFLADSLDQTEYKLLTNRDKMIILRWEHSDVSPIILHFPIGDQNAETILFSLHYDIHAQTVQTKVHGNFTSERGEKVYSRFGGADDLSGVASVLVGLVEATKDKNARRKYNVTVLISGGEEYGSKGVTQLFGVYGSAIFYDLGKITFDGCVVVDINDRIGTYCSWGSALDLVRIFADEQNIETLVDEYLDEFGERLRIKPVEIKNLGFNYSAKVHARNYDEMNRKIAFIKRFASVPEQAHLAIPFDCRKSANHLIERYRASTQKLGLTPKEYDKSLSLSDANVIADRLKIPCVLFSSGVINAHTEYEFVYADDLEKNALIIKDFLLA